MCLHSRREATCCPRVQLILLLIMADTLTPAPTPFLLLPLLAHEPPPHTLLLPLWSAEGSNRSRTDTQAQCQAVHDIEVSSTYASPRGAPGFVTTPCHDEDATAKDVSFRRRSVCHLASLHAPGHAQYDSFLIGFIGRHFLGVVVLFNIFFLSVCIIFI